MSKALLAKRNQLIKPSPTLAISAKAKALKEAGNDVVSFGAGEPDFDTPHHIKEAAEQALEKGDTKYTAVAGTPQMKQAIIQKFERDQKTKFAANEVMISCGGKHTLFNTLMALVDPGDEVLIPVPYWVSYPDMVRLAGGTAVFVQPKDETTWSVTIDDIARAMTPKTKAIIVNSPNNPTGSAYDKETLEGIVRLAIERNVFVISDEIYEKLVYGGFRFTSMLDFVPQYPKLKEQLLVAHGVAKTYSMTGWRIGYCAGPAWLVEAMAALQGASTSNPTSFAQAGAIAALSGPQDSVETMRVAFEKRARLIVDMLRDIPGVHCAEARGAFYAFPNVQKVLERGTFGKTDGELTDYLLTKHNVAVVPGTEFGAPGHLRLSFATGEEQIKKGVARIKAAVA
jgi:aspartate aminotransferase